MRSAARLGAALVVASALATAGCSSSSSGSAKAAASSGSASGGVNVRQFVFGSALKHMSQASGKRESLTKPDDIVTLGGNLFAAFQNGVDSQGEPAVSGNTDSTVVELTPSGSVVRQWDVKGKIDGLGTDTGTGQVIATVNEDGNSSLYAITPGSANPTHYTYSKALPHKGGTDSIVYYNGKLLITASAPGTTGNAPASAPAVYAVTLKGGTADVTPYFAGNASATVVNGASAGKKAALSLTDPDSSAVVPAGSPAFAGDFELTSQADQELIFTSGSGSNLSVLKVPQAIDDSAWVTSASGTLYATDSTSNTIDAITGLKPGTVYTSETPCDSANAPKNCPATGFPANSLATVNLKTGALTPVAGTTAVTPKGLLFVP